MCNGITSTLAEAALLVAHVFGPAVEKSFKNRISKSCKGFIPGNRILLVSDVDEFIPLC